MCILKCRGGFVSTLWGKNAPMFTQSKYSTVRPLRLSPFQDVLSLLQSATFQLHLVRSTRQVWRGKTGSRYMMWARSTLLETNISPFQGTLLSRWFSWFPQVGYVIVPWRVLPIIIIHQPKVVPHFSGDDFSFPWPHLKWQVCCLVDEIVCPKHCKDSTREVQVAGKFFEPRSNVGGKQQPLNKPKNQPGK